MQIPGYQIRHLLDWGAQGDVFLAVDGDSRPVALKVVVHDRAGVDRRSVERLRREARLLGAIRSPHVVAVHGLVETDVLSCLVLELLVGERLDAALRRRAGVAGEEPAAGADPAAAATQVLDPDQIDAQRPEPAPKREVPAPFRSPEHVRWALDVAVQLARALAELHAINLIHRDVKPQNVMLVGERVVLIDFGLARAAGVTTLTQSEQIVGSFGYLSPEQLVGGMGSQRGDVYACGAVLHTLLCGGPPEVVTASAGRRRVRPGALRRANPCVFKALAAVVARALEADPRDRHADAAQLLADLERCQRGEPVRIPASFGRTWRHHGRSAVRLAAVLCASLLLWLWAFGSTADDDAVRLLQLLRGEPAAAAAVWSELDEAQRVATIDELNRRLGGDPVLALTAARTLRLGLLRTGGRANHVGALVATADGTAPVAPPLSAFLPLDRPRSLLAPPGPAWFLVLSRDSRAWWAPHDPRCLQLAMELTVPEGDVIERSLQVLPTELPQANGTQWSVVTRPGETGHAVAVSRRELAAEDVRRLRYSLSNHAAARQDLDVWLRHPAEPHDVADTIWALWSARDRSDSQRPALVTFWEAHRLAAWAGGRLPTPMEWMRASGNEGRDGVDANGSRRAATRPVPAELADVGADALDDRTGAGVCFANSNVREWAAPWRQGPRRNCMALPVVANVEGEGLRFLEGRPIFDATPDALHGVRLYRSLVSD